MNRNKWVATFVALAAFTAAVALAGGSETKGKFFFKKNCKSCHTKGAKGGEVTPLTKTQEQWAALLQGRDAQQRHREALDVPDPGAAHRRADVPRQPRGRLAAAGDLRRLTAGSA